MSRLRFNTLLESAGINVNGVISLRHQERRMSGGRTAYQLWRAETQAFHLYQSQQSTGNRQMFGNPFWASFVAAPSQEIMFVAFLPQNMPENCRLTRRILSAAIRYLPTNLIPTSLHTTHGAQNRRRAPLSIGDLAT